MPSARDRTVKWYGTSWRFLGCVGPWYAEKRHLHLGIGNKA